MVKDRDEDAELPQVSQMRPRLDLETVVRAAAEHFSDDLSAWIEGRRCDGMGRAIAAAPARRLCAAPSREIAARPGYRNISTVPGACRRVRAAFNDRRFSKDLAQPRELLSH